MKAIFFRDKKRRSLINSCENTNLILKNLATNKCLKNSIRLNATLLLFNVFNDGLKSRLKNRCIVTGRSSKIHKKFRFSRLFFLKISRFGLVSGLRKASW